MSDSQEREEAVGPGETLRPESADYGFRTMKNAEDMADHGSPTHSGGGPDKQRSPSAAPRLERRDSMDLDPDFRGEQPPSESEPDEQKSPSPAPSLDSDDSMDLDPNFRGESPPFESDVTRLAESDKTQEIVAPEQKPKVSPAKVSSLQWSRSGILWVVPIILGILVSLYAGFYQFSQPEERPLATLTVEPQSPVFVGETVTLKCVIESLSDWTYKWYKGSSSTPVSEGNTFIIRGATESHKGQYWCQGERRDRPTSSQPSRKLTLDVKAVENQEIDLINSVGGGELAVIRQIHMEFNLKRRFTRELADSSSPQFKSLAADVTKGLDEIYSLKYGSQFLGTKINSFRPRSVVVDSVLEFKSSVQDSNMISVLREAVTEHHSSVSELNIELKSIKAIY